MAAVSSILTLLWVQATALGLPSLPLPLNDVLNDTAKVKQVGRSVGRLTLLTVREAEGGRGAGRENRRRRRWGGVGGLGQHRPNKAASQQS